MAAHMLTDEGRELVGRAVAEAEANSSGEIVTIVTAQSDSYADIALIWSAMIAFIALVVLALAAPFYLSLWDRLTGGWASEWGPRSLFGVAATVAMLKFLGTWLILLWRPLRLWLVPAPIRHRRVRTRAVTLFRAAADRRTSGRTGILIYLSTAERRAEIVADDAIATCVDPGVWGDAMGAMLAHLRDGRMAEGMAEAVRKVGIVLAEHLPVTAGDVNELPDRLIEV